MSIHQVILAQNRTYGDYTPAAVNWASITKNVTGMSTSGNNALQTFTGIDQPLTLTISGSDFTASGDAYDGIGASLLLTIDDYSIDVYKNGALANGISFGQTSATVSVSSGDTLYFLASLAITVDGTPATYDATGSTTTVTVTNSSDGNAVLDTFSVTLSVHN